MQRRSSGLFNPSVIKALVNNFIERLENIELNGGDFGKLIADIEECCFKHKDKIKGDFQVNGLISRLLHQGNELSDQLLIRRILRLKYITASDRDRPDEIQRYLKKFEEAFYSKKPELLEAIFEEIKLELESETILEDLRSGFCEILTKFVLRPNQHCPEVALKIADFMRHSDKVSKHHQAIADRVHANLEEQCSAARSWYSLPSCCSSRALRL